MWYSFWQWKTSLTAQVREVGAVTKAEVLDEPAGA